MKKPAKKAPVRERRVQDEQLRATTGGSGYLINAGYAPPPDPDPSGGT